MKTKLLLLVMLISCPLINAQIVNLYAPKATKTVIRKYDRQVTLLNGERGTESVEEEVQVEADPKPVAEWFDGGNIDYISSGLMQTNAHLLKVNIGNPAGFYVPFYIMAGADKETSSDDDDDPNKSTNVNLLSPNGGYLNIGLHGNNKLISFDDSGKTRLSAVYQLGAKTITGKDALTEERVSLLSLVSNVGLMYQTQAWDPEDQSKMGIAWIQAVFSNSFNNDEKIKQIYGNDVKKNFYGYNIEGGIQIEKHVNLRVGYYKYLNNQDINDDFKDGIFKLSVDFGLNE